MKLELSLLLACLALTKAYPNPQEVSLDDIDAKADDSARYGADVGALDADALKEIFGIESKPNYQVVKNPAVPPKTTPNAGTPPAQVTADNYGSSNGGVPKDIVVDDAFKQCAAYANSGYRCVPYYGCDNGEIIIDGAGLFNPRFGGLNDVELNPETSKCPGNFEMCCRHPDWVGLPITNSVEIKKPPVDVLVPTGGNGQQAPKDNGQGGNYVDPNAGPVVDPNAADGQGGGYVDPNAPIVDPNAAGQGDGGYVDPNAGPVVDPNAAGQGDGGYVDPNAGTVVDPNAAGQGDGGYVDPNTVPQVDPVPNGQQPGYPDPSNIIAIPNAADGYRPQCGNRNVGGVGVRIAQTSKTAAQTQFAEWPHMCAVLNLTKIGGIEHSLYVCGGSLIASNVVLTAAHCVDSIKDFSKVVVRCGEWDTQQEIEPLLHQDRPALDIKIHPGFVKKNLINDFAVIVLKEHFILNRHIDTICLPDPFFNDFSNQKCVATGWGKDVYGKKGAYQVIMKQVEMDMVDHGTCQNKLRDTRLGPFFELDKSFNCAGGEAGKDTCTGDGGGPLVCPNADGQYTQSGIIAWGVECGVNGVPGVYANVTEGLCFIDWATKCVLGQNADLYGLFGCRRWAKRQYCEIKEELEILDNLIASTNELKEKGKLFRKSRDLQRVLPSYEAAIKGCNNGPVDVDCLNFDYFPDSGDIDISVHSKINDEDEANEDSVDPRQQNPDDGKDIEVAPGQDQSIIESGSQALCSNFADQGFTCVHFSNCRAGEIITDGEGLINVRQGVGEVDKVDYKCANELDMCCRHADFSGLPIQAPISSQTLEQKLDSPFLQCGRRNQDWLGFEKPPTKSDFQAQFGEWPHMCAVTLINGTDNSTYVCGASLIAPQVVLTAAHHVQEFADLSAVRIRCGDWDIVEEVEPLPHQERAATDVWIHPEFAKRSLKNDFAVIVLNEPFELTSHIGTICLPDSLENNFSRQNCVATGWGKDAFDEQSEFQTTLKQVKMDLVDHDECQDQLRETRLGAFFELHESFNCAGGVEGTDVCTGDGGSPLVCPDASGRYVQTGIVAWGIGCGNGVPGVYANVSQGICFMDWAMKCSLGQDAEITDHPECNNWGQRKYCEVKEELAILKNQFSETETPKDQLKAHWKILDCENRLDSVVEALIKCSHDIKALNCDHFSAKIETVTETPSALLE